MTRPGASAKMPSSARPTLRSGTVKPGLSALVLSDSRSSTPLLPSSAKRCMAVGRWSMGVWSSLKSPVWTTVPTGVWMPRPTPSGMLWLTSRNSSANGPSVSAFELDDLVERHLALQPVLAQLGVDQRQGQPGAVHRHVDLLEQVGQRAHVVLVAVGEDDAQHAVLVLHDVGEVGQHQIDAEHLVVGEHEAGVDDENGVAVLQDHHVLADGPQSPEGYDFERLFSHGYGSSPPRASGLRMPRCAGHSARPHRCSSIGCSPDRPRVLAENARA